jgi:hypothetical protein
MIILSSNKNQIKEKVKTNINKYFNFPKKQLKNKIPLKVFTKLFLI